ncbi:aminoglycoside phosphotransferase family protein [Nocardia asteroides]|uniref:aminoglycoside phosphotransferase family protein n=1 Tax=Nocardia asteroides TaxID=1824 RepID=UPI0037C9414F
MTAIEDALVRACQTAGVNPAGRQLLHQHSNSVWLLAGGIVARVNRSDHKGLRARESIAITRWLASHQVPVTEPAHHQAVVVDGHIITFWVYHPQYGRATPQPAQLGAILRQLHALPLPPFGLPRYEPLTALTQVLDSPAAAVLDAAERVWLEQACSAVIEEYGALDSELGVGLVHGDAYSGNTLWGADGNVLLGDWDEAAIAPRELDLINTAQSARRFGTDGLDEFFAAYGTDIRTWPGCAVLQRMRDLHTLSAYIRRAGHGDQAAEGELSHRLRTLREPGAAGERWNIIA